MDQEHPDGRSADIQMKVRAMRSNATLPRIVAGIVVALLAGCASLPRATEPDGTFCFRVGKTKRGWRTCTTSPIPASAVEADAKRFEPRPDAVTLYVVRRRWADTAYQVPVEVDGRRRVDTIPSSFTRIYLAPGVHTLSLSWKGQSQATTVNGRPGELVFVDIDGAAWLGATSYRWQKGDQAESRARATRSRLIADLDLTAH